MDQRPQNSRGGPSDRTQKAAPASHNRTAAQPSGSTAGRAAAPNGAPPRRSIKKSVIVRDFKKRLRGKPTHAAPSRSWYHVLANTLFGIAKIVMVFVMLIVFIVGGFGGGMMAGYVSTVEPLTQFDITPTEEVQTGFIYDKDGNVLHKIMGNENIDRINISYADVKHTFIDEAIMSIEDERFYTHNGIDIRRIGSAVLSMLANSGNATHGGSTITQQTVKLVTGQDQRSTQRKIQEWFAAMDLEKEMSKDQIMGLYLNLAPMGNNYIGVQAAAKNYFGKDAKNLNLLECAFLAGIPKSPSYYNPSTESGRRNALRRMRIVLGKMHELGHITDSQYESALNDEIRFVERKQTSVSSENFSYFEEYAISQVRQDLMSRLNYSEAAANNLIYGSGLRIYTTMDSKVQSELDQTFNTLDLFQRYPELHIDEPEKPQASSVIIDNSNGSIAAMAGGFGDKTINFGLNRAVQTFRQPGSSIKPLVVYAPALQSKAVLPGSTVSSAKAPLNPKDPNDWPRGSTPGTPLTIRAAIRGSNNMVAVRTLYQISPIIPGTNDMERDYSTALNYLKLVGIDRFDEQYPAIAMGGFTKGMSTLEMSAAYATFPNGGVYTEPYAYTRVEDSKGNVILEREIETTNVYTPQVAFMMADMMKDVISGGTASSYVDSISGIDGKIDVAGKTGTTDNAKDKWFCGYTPYYSAATWYGYDNRLRSTDVPKSEESNAMRIWNDFMQRIHADKEAASFERPEGIGRISLCARTGLLPGDDCENTTSDWMPDGQRPQRTCTVCEKPFVIPTPDLPAE